MSNIGPAVPGSVGAAAAEAAAAQRAARGEGLTSLNRMLQWATANMSGNKDEKIDLEKLHSKVGDREWLDGLFPDMFQPVKVLVELLREDATKDEEKVEVLEALEEYMQDLNYAANVDKIGALDPVIEAAQRRQGEAVRVAALWVLGTCLQDLSEVKDVFLEKGGCQLLLDALRAEQERVRAKAMMATSALLRNSKPDISKQFRELGGGATLVKLMTDESANVRRRALFFLENSIVTGNTWLAEEVVADQAALDGIIERLEVANPEDLSEIEPTVGALGALAEIRISVMRQTRASEVARTLADDVIDPATKRLLTRLAARLTVRS